jgi:tetratricopeptide (TPR) repeat protein
MSRRYVLCAGLCVGAGALLCALVVGTLSVAVSAGPGDDVRAKIDTQLAVQKALQDGLEQLRRGNFQASVAALEKEVARIDGNKKYLETLTLAYRGYIQELQQTNQIAEVEKYRKRLEILDPGSRLERPADAPVVKVPDKPTPPPEQVKSKPITEAAPIQARGKLDDDPPRKIDDPAAEIHRKASPEAVALIERATKEMIAKRYSDAAKSYDQANKLDPASTTACCEQWSYCKMFAVSEAMSRTNVSPQATQDFEREINQAMAMTPKLETWGKALLVRLHDGSGGMVKQDKSDDSTTVELKHTPRQGQGWAMVETPNFRILHNQPQDVADKVARIAEATRLAMSRKWFGDDGEAWNPRCDIYLYATGEEYHMATQVTARSPGHSTMKCENDHIISRRIDLHVDHAEAFASVLPHEMTHVVVESRFAGIQMPRWADEGMAVLTEPPHRIDRYLRNLPAHDREHVLFPVGQLMRMDDYPEPQLVDPFYTQSVSLVDFLSREKGPQVFARFLREGLRVGYEPALKKYYKIENFGELEKRWRAFALPE